MSDKELIHTIPLRKKWLKVPKYKRTQKAIKAIREYAKKHSKKDDIKIGKYLNLKVWENGMKNPPHKITAKITKKEDYAIIELPDIKIEEPKKEEKKLTEKIKEKLTRKEKDKKDLLEKEEKELDKKLQPKDTHPEKPKEPRISEERKEEIYTRTQKST